MLTVFSVGVQHDEMVNSTTELRPLKPGLLMFGPVWICWELSVVNVHCLCWLSIHVV